MREEFVKRKDILSVMKIDTVEQLGDIFTKGLPRATFEYLRNKLMGWYDEGSNYSLPLMVPTQHSVHPYLLALVHIFQQS